MNDMVIDISRNNIAKINEEDGLFLVKYYNNIVINFFSKYNFYIPIKISKKWFELILKNSVLECNVVQVLYEKYIMCIGIRNDDVDIIKLFVDNGADLSKNDKIIGNNHNNMQPIHKLMLDNGLSIETLLNYYYYYPPR